MKLLIDENLSRPTDAGLKCRYTATGTVQEVFLICSDAEAAKAWLAGEGITAGSGE